MIRGEGVDCYVTINKNTTVSRCPPALICHSYDFFQRCPCPFADVIRVASVCVCLGGPNIFDDVIRVASVCVCLGGPNIFDDVIRVASVCVCLGGPNIFEGVIFSVLSRVSIGVVFF